MDGRTRSNRQQVARDIIIQLQKRGNAKEFLEKYSLDNLLYYIYHYGKWFNEKYF